MHHPPRVKAAAPTETADPAITPGWVKRGSRDHVTIPSMGKKQGKHKQHDAEDPAPAGTLQPHSPATKQVSHMATEPQPIFRTTRPR